MGPIYGTQGTTTSQNQPILISVKNTLSGMFRKMTCVFFKKQSENNATRACKTTDNTYLRGGYDPDPGKRLSDKLKETLPKFEVEAYDLETALTIIGRDCVDDFGKYIKGFEKILNKHYDSSFIITVAKVYAVYRDVKSADKTPSKAWDSIFKKAEEYSDAKAKVDDENQSVYPTAEPEIMELQFLDAWQQLKDTILGEYEKMSEELGDELHLTREQYQAYAFQRIAVETDHLPDHNPIREATPLDEALQHIERAVPDEILL